VADWRYDLAWFLGGALFVNAIPHLVAGLMGTPFRTPFSVLAGRPHSPPPLNLVWAAMNLAAAWVLLAGIGHFDLRAPEAAAAAGAGGLLIGLHLSRR
jgi:hypothetical protein